MNKDVRSQVEQTIWNLLKQSGQGPAVEAALKAYGSEIYGVVFRIMGDETAADDVWSMFLEKLWKGIRTFKERGKFRAWAYRVARNACNEYRRNPTRRKFRRFFTGELSKLEGKIRSSTKTYEKTTVRQKLWELVDRLKPDDKLLMILKVDKGLSYTEIAEVFSGRKGEVVSADALKSRKYNIKKKLRKMAEEEGISL